MYSPTLARSALVIALIAGLYAIGYSTGQATSKETIALLPLLVAAFLRPARLVPVARVFFAAAVLGLLVARFQAPHQGTYRWLTIPGLGTAQMAIPCAVATALAAGTMQNAILGSTISALGSGLLVATRSFSSATLAAATVFVAGTRRTRVILGIACLGAVIIGVTSNPNRARRVAEHFAGTTDTYQVRQLKKVWAGAILTGVAPTATTHLPAYRDDLAFVDTVRKRGRILGVLVLVLQGAVLWLMFDRIKHGAKTHPMAPHATVVYTGCLFGHLCVNFGILPPTGIPMPFLGRGGASWFSFGVLMMVFATRSGEAETEVRTSVLIPVAKFGCLAILTAFAGATLTV